MVTMLVRPLMGVKDPSKIQNRQVAKLRIVLIPIVILILFIITVDKTLILGLPQNKIAVPLDILRVYRLYLC